MRLRSIASRGCKAFHFPRPLLAGLRILLFTIEIKTRLGMLFAAEAGGACMAMVARHALLAATLRCCAVPWTIIVYDVFRKSVCEA